MQTRSRTTHEVESRKKKKEIVSSSIITRSMESRKFEFEFDFDDSFLEWRKNEISINHCTYYNDHIENILSHFLLTHMEYSRYNTLKTCLGLMLKIRLNGTHL